MTKKRAPKTKLTSELQERITAFLRAGSHVENVARVGIPDGGQ